MAQIQIHPLHLGFITRPIALFCEGLDQDVNVDLPLIAWYLEGSDQKILIDTGGGDPLQANPKCMPYKRIEDQSIENALARIGIMCEDIELVINTHLHWDHACGNQSFSQARFLVQEDELRYARSQPSDAPGACPAKILEMNYETVKGDTQVAEGVRTLFTPGHTPGLQGILVDGAQRQYFLAGDNLPLFQNLEGEPFRKTNIVLDPLQYQNSLEKIAGLSAFILPSHDIRVFDQQVYL
jgi:N-acyl homoserine lactone hydrolase